MMDKSKSVLVVAVSAVPPGREAEAEIGGWMDPIHVKKIMNAQVEEATSSGIELDLLIIKPDQSEFHGCLRDFRSRLLKQPAACIIGNGIRGTIEFSEFFEQLVHACHEVSPSTRLGFNRTPLDVLECAKRVLMANWSLPP